MPEIRVLLPALRLLSADTPLPYALREGKTWLRSATPRSLAELAGLHRGARVTAFVQPGDMALAAAPLPPLTPARLKVAAAGAVELLALGDADALLVAHGARAADGNVCLAWIAREQAERAQALIEGCGLTAAALAPLPLWLPRTPDGWTLMQGDDWVALRAGSDHVEIHAIARTDMPSGDVSRADTGAMDSVGGHAAGADKPGVGSSGADIPGVQALLRALETARPARIVWIGGIPPWWPHDVPAEQGREIEAGADVAPGWNVTLVRRASAVAGSWRGAIKWAAIAATVWIGGLQLQAWRLERGAAELRAHVHGRVQQAFPALARVTDPLRQVRQQLQGGPGQSEFAFLLGAATQHLAFATGEVAGLRYADGALDVEMAPGARRDPAPEGGTPDWIKAAAKDGVSVEPQAGGWRLRRAPPQGAAPASRS